ncbi:hypothetical protein DL768_010344 [Monosporascus sp. mg162]|nr:hypothetical protein DL768_010344 [Monosporascus sp. mg162]
MEVIHYLQLIHKTWVYIMGSEAALKFVDGDAVRELESRVPGISRCDERHAEIQIRKEGIFRAVIDGNQRDLILQKLKQVEHLIPSIRTLQEDFKYLRPCLPPLKADVDEEDYKLLPYDAKAWHKLAVRARELGFSSDEILRLYNTDPDREVAIKALYDARPPRLFDYGPNFELIVNKVTKAFKTAKPVESEGPPAKLTSHMGERVARRCGRVYSDTYDKDRHYITPENVTSKVQKDADITSLFVRRSVFHAFWGWQDDLGDSQGNDQRNDQNDQNTDDLDAIMNDQNDRNTDDLDAVNDQNYQDTNDGDDVMDGLEGEALAPVDQEMRDAAVSSINPNRVNCKISKH